MVYGTDPELLHGKGIDPTILPTSNRNAFYLARRAFYVFLDEKRI